MRGRRFAGGHQLARIFVAQLIEREVRERGDLHGFGQQLGWIEPGKPRALAQVALAIGMQPRTRLGDRDAVAHRGQRVLQTAPRAHVHVDIARRREGQAAGLPQGSRARQPFTIEAITRELHGDPGAAGEGAGYPLALPRFRPERRQPQRQRANARRLIAEELFDVGTRE